MRICAQPCPLRPIVERQFIVLCSREDRVCGIILRMASHVRWSTGSGSSCVCESSYFHFGLCRLASNSTTQSTRSSPSPPPTPANAGHMINHRRRRRSTLSKPPAGLAVVDWSTSYMASASSSHSHKALGLSTEDGSTLENSTDDDSIQSRPATVEPKPLRFTRSISPLALRRNIDPKESIPANSAQQASHGRGRSSSLRSSHTTGHHHHQPRKSVHLFRRYYSFNPYIPRLSAQIDTRKLLEHLILFTAVTVALAQFSVSPNVVHELWIIRGIIFRFILEHSLINRRTRHSCCCFSALFGCDANASWNPPSIFKHRTWTQTSWANWGTERFHVENIPDMDDYPEGL